MNTTIGEHLRFLREHKKLSQGDIEERTGLLRCYISRVENGHTVPAVETLEKIARALEIPMYQLFYDGSEDAPSDESDPFAGGFTDGRNSGGKTGWGSSRKDSRYLQKLRKTLSRVDEEDRQLILYMTQKMVAKKNNRAQGGSRARGAAKAAQAE